MTAEEINDEIDELFSDMTVSRRTALERMEEIASNVEGKIDALKEDIKREGDE